MSPRPATARASAPARKPAAPRRAPLAVVSPAPWRPPRAPFVVLLLAVAAAGLVGLLVLNTVVAQAAFTLHDLDRRTAQLREQERRLRGEVAVLEAPAALAQRATGLGLVPAGDPVFLRSRDGVVLGNPVPAQAPPPPPKPAPSPSPSPSPKSAPAPRPSPRPSPR